MINFAPLPLAGLFAIFAAAALLVWWAGARLPRLAAAIGHRAGVGEAFAGMLLLSGITSLPELATTSSAAAFDAPALATNNVLGSAAFNVLLLAIADMIFGRGALTAAIAKPATLLQGVLGMILLGAAAALATVGDVALWGFGAGSAVLFAGCVGAMGLAAGYESRATWTVLDPPGGDDDEAEERAPGRLPSLALRLAGLALLILAAGVMLSQSADSIAERTGLGDGLVGLVLLAGATSLPELTAITAAVRGGHYELAVGDIFGANLFNVAMLFLIDLIAPGPPVLETAGRFEAVAAMLALLLTGLFVVGLLERADRSLLRMGYDSLAALLLYGGGIAVLASLPS